MTTMGRLGAGLWSDPHGMALIATLVDGGFDAGTLNLIVNSGASLQDLQDLLDKKLDGATLLAQLTHSTPAAEASAASQASAQALDAQKAADAAQAAKSLAAGQPVPDSITLQIARGVYAQPTSAALTSATASQIATSTMKSGGNFDDATAAVAAGSPASPSQLAPPSGSAGYVFENSGTVPQIAATSSWFSDSTSIGGAQIPNVAIVVAIGLLAFMTLGGKRRR